MIMSRDAMLAVRVSS